MKVVKVKKKKAVASASRSHCHRDNTAVQHSNLMIVSSKLIQVTPFVQTKTFEVLRISPFVGSFSHGPLFCQTCQRSCPEILASLTLYCHLFERLLLASAVSQSPEDLFCFQLGCRSEVPRYFLID